MRTYLLNLPDRFRRFDEQLDVEHKEQSILQRLIEKESKRKKILQQFIDESIKG